MCLRVISKTRPKPKIAKRDISVFKIIRKDGTSVWFSMLWKKGWHYYQTGNKFGVSRLYETDIWEISTGLHSYENTVNIELERWQIRIDLYIPKGAEYFKSEGCYVSSELVYV